MVALPSHLHRLPQVLGAIPELRLALLFGSQARATQTPNSDLDLAVDAPANCLSLIAARVSEAIDLEVDVVSLHDASIPLQRELIRDGLVVYQRSPGAGATWRSQTLAQLETDGPWFDRMRDAWLASVAKRGLKDG